MSALRQGIYAILDYDHLSQALPSSPGDERLMWMAYADAAVDNGAVALQLRAKSVPSHSLYLSRLYRDLLERFGEQVPVLLNDYTDVAAPFASMSGCGVHVGQDDDSPHRVRAVLGRQGVVGVSTHNLKQLEQLRKTPTDYLALGPILSTSSKDNPSPEVGWDTLKQACALTAKPVVAIGGMSLEHVETAKAAGAHAVATISGWLGSRDALKTPDQAGLAMSMFNAVWCASPGAPK